MVTAFLKGTPIQATIENHRTLLDVAPQSSLAPKRILQNARHFFILSIIDAAVDEVLILLSFKIVSFGRIRSSCDDVWLYLLITTNMNGRHDLRAQLHLVQRMSHSGSKDV